MYLLWHQNNIDMDYNTLHPLAISDDKQKLEQEKERLERLADEQITQHTIWNQKVTDHRLQRYRELADWLESNKDAILEYSKRQDRTIESGGGFGVFRKVIPKKDWQNYAPSVIDRLRNDFIDRVRRSGRCAYPWDIEDYLDTTKLKTLMPVEQRFDEPPPPYEFATYKNSLFIEEVPVI
jgi:hypothetical protein